MTDKQIMAAKKTLPNVMEYSEWTPEQKKLDRELMCRDMINSCLCYGGISGFWSDHSFCRPGETYADVYIRDLGIDRVRELVAEQQADFARAVVLRDVYTDSEGCSYNSIVWADD